MGSRLHQPGVRDLLAKYPTLTALRTAGRSRIERAIAARSPRIAAKVTAAVTTALAGQDVTMPAEAAGGRVIAELAAELDRVCARRDALPAEIQEAFLARPFGELPASMPGIGRRTGARILAEIGDGSAFYDRKRAEGKRHNATLICLARRCCDVILAILRTGQAARAARHAELADVA